MATRTRTAHTPRVREGEEIWETTTPGRVWVQVTDDRGKERAISVSGPPPQRLRIRTLDREISQDLITDDVSDPFTNGLLKRIDADQQAVEGTQSDQVLSTEDLMLVFGKKGNAFQAAVKALNELNVRRMIDMAEAVDATASQISFLREHAAQWRQEGDTPTYREIKAGPQGGQGI